MLGPRRRDPAARRHPAAAPPEQPDPRRRGRASARRRWSRASPFASPRGDVPPPLKDVRLRGARRRPALQAGASMKGEFEERLKSVIAEIQASAKPIILFIDEAHTLIGAGGAGGAGRRGEPAQAGAGARHAAHDRRHDLGGVQEVRRAGCRADPPLPDRQESTSRTRWRVRMMRGVAPDLQKHHSVRMLDAAVRRRCPVAALPSRARQLPDKAGQRARHRLCPGGREPSRDPGRAGGHRRGTSRLPRRSWTARRRSGWPARHAARRREEIDRGEP